MLRLDEVPSAAFAVILAVLAHRVEWPIARGGSRQIAAALEAHVRTLGGRIVTGRRIANLDEPPASADPMRCLPPRHPRAGWVPASGATSAQARTLSTCSGVFKLDWALGAPIPWRTTACAQAGTVHLGGSLEETEAAERDVASGRRPEWPFVILAQPSLFDPTRAPSGRHTAWAYCHVPNGSMEDMTAAIERQIERFAPGFGATILARHTMRPARASIFARLRRRPAAACMGCAAIGLPWQPSVRGDRDVPGSSYLLVERLPRRPRQFVNPTSLVSFGLR
jgi:phytoene dehydrogenase-like protein